MTTLKASLKTIKRNYWPLIKSLQTALLLITGLAGFMSARCPVLNPGILLSLSGSLFLAISGSTVLNMWYDRDIDARMKRTCQRPLPSGQLAPSKALALGLGMSALGVGWAFMMMPLYGLVIFAGLFFDVVIYTMWLKRRTAWGIVWGGISGGMPVLAGRVLGLGYIDWVGMALCLSVLFWIPTHILTFSMRYFDDYKNAGVPTFPSTYGFGTTRKVIAVSSLIAAIAIAIGAVGFGMAVGYLRVIAVLSVGLFLLAVGSVWKPSERVNFGLFKYASLYMLGAMLLMALDGM
ncbi:MAG: protoheme IX farnesyltransferase [Chloroflexi bacterium]|nr:MAG: protoheme IX farnesyltransferase [Chloroflexota bacterium]MBL1192978.1 protoheme IX farnesyltransferase [Chloroflexota bacterium]NOH10270.1 protoheme IX farnesyltransferase [Chloroflexota bacterium]